MWRETKRIAPGLRYALRECLEATEGPLHHVRRSPALDTADRFNRALDRPQILPGQHILVAGKAHFLPVLIFEINRDAWIRNVMDASARQDIGAKRNVAGDDDVCRAHPVQFIADAFPNIGKRSAKCRLTS